MNKIWLIIKREYYTRIRKKSFIISTLLGPLALILFLGFQIAIAVIGGADEKKVIVKDESGWFTHEVAKGKFRPRFSDSANGELKFTVSYETLDNLRDNYAEMGYDGVLHIPDGDLNEIEKASYYSQEKLGLGARASLESKLTEELRKLMLTQKGLDQKTMEELRSRVVLDERNDEGEEASSVIASVFGFFMGFLMYATLIFYGTMVMKGVSEEKTTRIVEVILSSVKPFQLLAGKIVGIGLVGLTQFSLWIISAGVIYSVFGLVLAMSGIGAESMDMQGASGSVDMDAMEAQIEGMMNQVGQLPLKSLAFSFIFYFFGGYLLYSALFAAVGSLAGEDSSDSQSLTFPIMIPIILSIVILPVVMQAPNGSLAFWSSIIPFTSSVIMPARIAYGLPIISLDFFLSVFLMIAGFIATIWLAAKIYRVGILMRGKRPSLRELARWVRY